VGSPVDFLAVKVLGAEGNGPWAAILRRGQSWALVRVRQASFRTDWLFRAKRLVRSVPRFINTAGRWLS
jgi:hypothetical protein